MRRAVSNSRAVLSLEAVASSRATAVIAPSCASRASSLPPAAALLALLPITTFALVDAQYLRIERRFRALFDRVRSEDWGTFPSFEVNLKNAPPVPYGSVFGSWSIINFYAPLALAVVLVVLSIGLPVGCWIFEAHIAKIGRCRGRRRGR
jgi:hypothetical protein